MIQEQSAPRPTAGPGWFVEPTLGQRLVGSLLDSLLLLPISALYLAGRTTATVLAVGAAHGIYEVTLTARTGRTVGKVLMGTAALDAVEGTVISVARAVVRWFILSGMVFALSLPFGRGGLLSSLGGLWGLVVCVPVLSGPFHRGLHDRAAGTLVTSVRSSPGRSAGSR